MRRASAVYAANGSARFCSREDTCMARMLIGLIRLAIVAFPVLGNSAATDG